MPGVVSGISSLLVSFINMFFQVKHCGVNCSKSCHESPLRLGNAILNHAVDISVSVLREVHIEGLEVARGRFDLKFITKRGSNSRILPKIQSKQSRATWSDLRRVFGEVFLDTLGDSEVESDIHEIPDVDCGRGLRFWQNYDGLNQ